MPELPCTVQESAAGLALIHGEQTVSMHAGWPDAYDALVHHVCDQVIHKYTRGLAMHAACVSWQGAGVLIPGVSGAGKTTLTAWLLRRGLHYLTDELTLGGASHGRVQGWSRALRVKTASVPQVAPWAEAPGDRMLYAGGAFIEARCFGAATVTSVQPAALIFPRRVPNLAAAEVQPLTRAQAALRLWPSVVNVRLLEARGMAQVTQLVRGLRAYEWVYADVQQLEPALAALRATLASAEAAAAGP